MKHISQYLHADDMTFILASRESNNMIFHHVGLPCERETGYGEIYVAYECRVGPDCPFCRQYNAEFAGTLPHDTHTCTRRACTYPVYDTKDGVLKLVTLTKSAGKILSNQSVAMESVINITKTDHVHTTAYLISALDGGVDREKYPIIEDDWVKRLDFGTLVLTSVEEAERLQEYQLAALRKAHLCRYTVDYLEKRWNL